MVPTQRGVAAGRAPGKLRARVSRLNPFNGSYRRCAFRTRPSPRNALRFPFELRTVQTHRARTPGVHTATAPDPRTSGARDSTRDVRSGPTLDSLWRARVLLRRVPFHNYRPRPPKPAGRRKYSGFPSLLQPNKPPSGNPFPRTGLGVRDAKPQDRHPAARRPSVGDLDGRRPPLRQRGRGKPETASGNGTQGAAVAGPPPRQAPLRVAGSGAMLRAVSNSAPRPPSTGHEHPRRARQLLVAPTAALGLCLPEATLPLEPGHA